MYVYETSKLILSHDVVFESDIHVPSSIKINKPLSGSGLYRHLFIFGLV